MARTDAPVVVADAGPLIHLDELAALDVLADFPEIWVPEDVWSEVALHRPQALRQSGIRLLRREASPVSARMNAIAALYSLHRGERAALALCLERSIGTLLTDDTAARLAATSHNLVTHGTLGLLIRYQPTALTLLPPQYVSLPPARHAYSHSASLGRR